MILLLLMGCGVVEITNPSSFSFVLTDSYLAAGGDVQPTGQNSQRCGRAMARRCQNARCRIYVDEDISANVTPTSPPSTHIGPVTRARARQLNYQVLSFL